ncbi:flavodoxin family protein [Chloroflexota bacterium]
MLKVIIVYESKYGNTKLVAENIIESIKEVQDIEVSLHEVKSIDMDDVINSDAILIGSPNNWGRATGNIRKFIDGLGEINLNSKPAAVFDTYISRDFEKAVRQMEKQITEKVPSLKLATPGLSIKVKSSKGPILEEELPKCMEFGIKFGELIKG